MPLLSVLILIVIHSQSGMTINSTLMDKLIAETFGSHSALDLMLCSKEVYSNITCPADKYVTSKCVCATCLDFGDPCTVDSQCCQSPHMSCWKFAGLSGAHCLCDDTYSWDAYTATCFMPANLPQQMLMITLYSFIAMFVFVGVLFTLAHVCDFSICGKLKPRNNEYEAGDMHFLQEPETRSNRDMPPSYSQIFPEYCPQGAMVNAGLDLALPLYSQAVAQQTDEVEQEIITSQHQFTLHQVRLEPPPAYEETDSAQISLSYSLHPIALPETNDNLHDDNNIIQVPTIIITPSENAQDNPNQFTDDPDSDTPPAALLQVPNRSELESVNVESPPIITSTISVELNKPIFVSTMDIVLENPSFHFEDEIIENSNDENLNLNYLFNDTYLVENPQPHSSEYSKCYGSLPQNDNKSCFDNKWHDNPRFIEPRELTAKKFDIPILPTILEESNIREEDSENKSLKHSKILEVVNDVSEIPSTSKNTELYSLQETNKNEQSRFSKSDITDSFSHNKLFKFDYTKFCNFERSMKEGSKNGNFKPSTEDDHSSYTSPACQM